MHHFEKKVQQLKAAWHVPPKRKCKHCSYTTQMRAQGLLCTDVHLKRISKIVGGHTSLACICVGNDHTWSKYKFKPSRRKWKFFHFLHWHLHFHLQYGGSSHACLLTLALAFEFVPQLWTSLQCLSFSFSGKGYSQISSLPVMECRKIVVFLI